MIYTKWRAQIGRLGSAAGRCVLQAAILSSIALVCLWVGAPERLRPGIVMGIVAGASCSALLYRLRVLVLQRLTDSAAAKAERR